MSEVRIGLYGTAGHQITGTLDKLTRARLTAVAGVDEHWFRDAADRNPNTFAGARHYASLETMLEHAEIDLISFCSSRRADQCAQCIAALQAGKHVLAEKPMAFTLEDLAALQQEVDVAGRQLRTMTSMIYQPAFVGMRKAVVDGVIGQVVQSYAMKSYPYRDSRPQDRSIDGGLIRQAGIHAVGYVRYVTGLEFTEVFAQDTDCGNPKDGELQMAANIACRMNNGSLATIVCNYCNPPGIGFWGNDQLRVHGTAGMIELVDGETRRCLVCGEDAPTEFDDVDPPVSYPQDLIDCILDGTPTLLSQEDSFLNTKVVICAQQSASTGQPVQIPA